MHINGRIAGILLLFPGLPLSACEDPAVPEVAPRIEAIVNGSPWRANFQEEAAVADLMESGAVLEVVGLQIDADGSTEQVGILIAEFSGPGTYSLGGESSARMGYYLTRPSRDATPIEYRTDASHTGSIAIERMDAKTRSIWGTFSFRAQNEESGETVTISAGEFEGRYVEQS